MARKSREKELLNSSKPIKNKEKCQSNMEIGDTGRISKEIRLKNRIKIYCNSLETEYNYFTSFKNEVNSSKISDISIEVLKTQTKGGLDPLRAVKYIIGDRGDCDEVWVVFDKDHFDIEGAIRLAEKNNINVAWSNECFELWLLLHFNSLTTFLGRKEALEKVKEVYKKTLKITYEKNSKEEYQRLRSRMRVAIAYAKKQHQLIKRDGTLPNKANPCTTVYKLAEFLMGKILK